MKKKFLFLILTVLATACLSIFAGCSIFGEKEETEESTPPPAASGLKAPESVRLDMGTNMLYVPDCSESGVTYYEVQQVYGGSMWKLGALSTEGIQAVDGYFAIDVGGNISENYSSFDLKVICKAKWNDEQGVSNSFTFQNVGGITYDQEHCSFDEDTGIFTWTEVKDATRYRVWMDYSFSVVDVPQVTVPQNVTIFRVVPLFDTYKIGTTVEVNLEASSPQISYDQVAEKFTWQGRGDSYKLEITQNGATTAYNLTGNEFAFTPSSDSVTVKLTAFDPLRYSGVAEVTYDVLPSVTGISVGALSRELSWDAISGITEYVVSLEYGDGDALHYVATTNKYVISTLIAGEVKARIKPIVPVSLLLTMAAQAEFEFVAIEHAKDISPTLSYDAASQKVSLSFSHDSPVVESYKITMTVDGAQEQVEVDADGKTDISARITMPAYKAGQIVISRNYHEYDFPYCFTTGSYYPNDYSQKMIYIPAPEVEMVDKNAELRGGRAFTVRVKYPEELQSGSLSLHYSYGTSSKTETMTADKDITLALPGYTTDFKASFTAYQNSSYKLFTTDEYSVTTSCLDKVNISADNQKLYWAEVDGAACYVVEELTGNIVIGYEYVEVQRSVDTEYSYGITETGVTHTYRVTAISRSEDAFTFDGDANDIAINKLARPTVSFTQSRKISVSAALNATLVTYLDGVQTAITDESIRAALDVKASVKFTAYCTRENAQGVTYIDSDTDEYTVYRIPDLDGLNLNVDAANNKVSWAKVEGASEYTCHLYRRLSAEDEYALLHDYSGTETEIDGSSLLYGEFEIKVMPTSRRDGNDFYLYYGDYATDTFRKDGILAAGISDKVTGFWVDGAIASADDIDVGWSVSTSFGNKSYSYNFDEPIDISKYADFEYDFMSYIPTGYTYRLMFNVNYGEGGDEYLSANKILKADRYELKIAAKNSWAANVVGSYEYVERLYSMAQVKVTLTPEGLRGPYKSFSIYHSISNNSYTTDGTEVIVGLPDIRTTYQFTLVINSDMFAIEDDTVVFYRTSNLSAFTYSVSFQETLKTQLNGVSLATNVLNVDISLGLISSSTSGEYLNIEYLSDNGTWETRPVFAMNGLKRFNISIPQASNLTLTAGKQIRIRVRWAERTVNGVKYEASDWDYITVTVPA